MDVTPERLIQDIVNAAREYLLDRAKDKKVGRFCDECGRRRMVVQGVETLHKADCPRKARVA